MKPAEPQEQFVFRRNDEIGAAAAEDDLQFLKNCFIDTGDLQQLSDCASGKRIIVGRTGEGKSALLTTLAEERENVVELSPHTLSLNYIANNGVIQFFEEAGLSLIPFYTLLWKHIFVVEFLRARYNITNEDSQRITMRRLRELFYRKDHIKEQAVDYLEKWGNRFWLTSDERMRELTTRIERSLSSSLDGTAAGIPISASGAQSLSQEDRKEIVRRGKSAVSSVQIRELENIVQVLADDVFADPQKPYYLTIDMLDEEWADDRIKFRLIKALLDTVRSFRKVHNVKVIVAMRYDLLDKVMHSSSDAGFQEEKYESLYLKIKWNRNDLERLVKERLNYLVRRRYTKQQIEIGELLPGNIDKKPSFDYMLARTFHRPRDIILFLNEAIKQADGSPSITAEAVKRAEVEYSRKRLQSLFTEWRILFPNLRLASELFEGFKSPFNVSDVTKDLLSERFQELAATTQLNESDPIVQLLNELYTPDGNFSAIRNNVIRNLYFVGFLGVKSKPTGRTKWSYETSRTLTPGEVRPSSRVYIHPMFYRALDISV